MGVSFVPDLAHSWGGKGLRALAERANVLAERATGLSLTQNAGSKPRMNGLGQADVLLNARYRNWIGNNRHLVLPNFGRLGALGQ